MATFLDVNTGFTVNRRPDLLTDDEAIIFCSLMNLFGCLIGQRSRTGQPEYGSRLLQFLQEPCTPRTASDIEIDFLEAIARWEPRIRMNLSETRVTMLDSRIGYHIRLAFYMIYGNTKDLVTLEFEAPVGSLH